MATGRAFCLNLDVERELDDPRGYRPAQVLRDRAHQLRADLANLIGVRDAVLLPGATDRLPPGTLGVAWCPTPSAVATLSAAGATVPPHPPLSVLQRVNARAFQLAYGQAPLCPVHVRDENAALAALARPSPHGRFLMKRDLSFAGRGHRRVDGEPNAQDLAFLRKSFVRGAGVLIEQWVTRELDVSMHGFLWPSGRFVLGPPVPIESDARGVYRGVRAVADHGLTLAELDQLVAAARWTGRVLLEAGYFGPFGVDAFRYRLPGGGHAFQPLCEINARLTMAYGHSGLPLTPDES